MRPRVCAPSRGVGADGGAEVGVGCELEALHQGSLRARAGAISPRREIIQAIPT